MLAPSRCAMFLNRTTLALLGGICGLASAMFLPIRSYSTGKRTAPGHHNNGAPCIWQGAPFCVSLATSSLTRS